MSDTSRTLYPLTSPQREIWFDQMLHDFPGSQTLVWEHCSEALLPGVKKYPSRPSGARQQTIINKGVEENTK